MPSVLLEVKDLSKYFAQFPALQNVSLEINQGEIFGLLGPNAAGKTTFIKCVFNFLKISQGEIFYQGKPLSPIDVRRDFGYLPENFMPPRELNGAEFLKILGLGLGFPLQNINPLFDELEIEPQKRISQYSRGMIQKLGLATALLKNPKFVVLDEPTLGLDPLGQSRMLLLLKKLNKQGKTIFFCSHNLFQVQSICTKIAIISQGQIKFSGAVEEFLNKHNTASLEQAFLKEMEKEKKICEK